MSIRAVLEMIRPDVWVKLQMAHSAVPWHEGAAKDMLEGVKHGAIMPQLVVVKIEPIIRDMHSLRDNVSAFLITIT